jgi:hypothetical protein
MKTHKTSILTFAASALLFASVAAFAADPTGNWTWTTPGRNGGPDRANVLSLKVEGTQLTGKLSSPGRGGKATETPITDGKVEGDSISFKVVREVNGNSVTNSYTGKIAGEKITGKIAFVRNGEASSRDWEAKISKN